MLVAMLPSYQRTAHDELFELKCIIHNDRY
jgi:hypothetical protein